MDMSGFCEEAAVFVELRNRFMEQLFRIKICNEAMVAGQITRLRSI
jgi:hypothetical protein